MENVGFICSFKIINFPVQVKILIGCNCCFYKSLMMLLMRLSPMPYNCLNLMPMDFRLQTTGSRSSATRSIKESLLSRKCYFHSLLAVTFMRTSCVSKHVCACNNFLHTQCVHRQYIVPYVLIVFFLNSTRTGTSHST